MQEMTSAENYILLNKEDRYMRLHKRILCFIIVTAMFMIQIPVSYAISQMKDEFVSAEQRFWNMVVDEKRNLAYVSDGNTDKPVGVKIVDIKDPEQIKVVQTVKNNDLVRGIAIYKNYLYSVAVDKSRIDITNVSDVQNPELTGKFSVAKAKDVYVFSGKLYILANDGLYVYDLKDPMNPQKLSSISGLGNLQGFTSDGKFAYAANTSGKLYILDANTLEQVAVESVDGMNYPGCMLRYKNYLYVSQPNRSDPKFWQYDVSDSTKPQLIKAYDDVDAITRFIINDEIMYTVTATPRFEKYSLDENGCLSKKELSLEIAGGGVGVFLKDKYEIVTTGSNIWVYDSAFEIKSDMLPRVPGEKDIEESEFECKFTDISDSYSRGDIIRLNELGVLEGENETTFLPNNKVTAIELYTALVKAFEHPLKRYKNGFLGIDENSPYVDYYQTALECGFVSEKSSDGTEVNIEKDITFTELAEIIMNAYIIESKTKDYKSGYDALKTAIDLDFINQDVFDENNYVTRADMAYAVNRVRAAVKGEAVFLDKDKYPVENNRSVNFTGFLDNSPEEAGADGNLNIPPTIMRVTDAVKPGELFNIYGEGFDAKSEVYIESATDSDVMSAPSKNSVKCGINEIDDEGQYIATQLPKDSKPGAYKVWVSNSYGFSRAYILNKVRVQWIDRTETAYDMPFRVLGMNMCGAEFDAEMASGVSLVNGDKAYDLNIVSVNPYCIEASVPENVPSGTYKLAASNDGIIWDKSGDVEEITVVGKVEDPLNLGMAWANRFVWDKKVDVTKAPYNIVPDGSTDNTEIIQKAIDDLKAEGGGIVYLPEGMYKISTIYLPSKVVIMGDGMDKTTVLYCDRDETHKLPMITVKDDGKTDGIVGAANLCVKVLPGESVPDMFFWFCEDWGANIDDRKLRTAKHAFVKGCRIEGPFDANLTSIAGRRGIGIIMVMDSDVLVKDNVMYGQYNMPASNYVGSYAYYINNKSISGSGHIFSVTCRGVFENNSLEYRHDLVSSSYSQGIFCRGYGYLHNNQFRNNGETSANAGEIMCTEPYRSGTMLYGNVEEVNGLNVKISLIKNADGKEMLGYGYNEENAWNVTRSAAGENYIIITEGRGLGQYRKLVSADKENRILSIDKPWDVVPDKTSEYVVLSPSIGTVQYDNWAMNTKKGCWLYGDNIDCVIARNNLNGCEGAYARSFHWVRSAEAAQCTISYYSRLTGNQTRGFSKLGNHCGIGIIAGATTKDFLTAYTAIGTDIKNNIITGSLPVPISTAATEAQPLNGIYVSATLGGSNQNHYTLKGAIVENNTVTNMDRGITVGGGEKGLFLHNNNFETNTTPIVGESKTIKIIQD